MKRGNLTAVGVTIALTLSMWKTPAFAYFGPGAGLAAIGSLLALVVGVIAAFFGFLWYPVKRLLSTRRAAAVYPSNPKQTTHGEAGDKSV
jgi:hypothetical protein